MRYPENEVEYLSLNWNTDIYQTLVWFILAYKTFSCLKTAKSLS